ncbi:MAG: LLM class flavin-dependent oxidoreductase [Microbacteriaceae bacterium]
MTLRLGIAFVPTLQPETLPQFARDAEAAGLDEIWMWEDCFKQSGIASAAIALASTERIEIGIGLLPAPLRNVALTAMELATVARVYPGRLHGGVGHGVQSWMKQVGAKAASPMTLLREYAEALRRLLDGETVTVDGRYVQLDAVALDWPPQTRVPLWLGGEGPKSLALTGELGDGTLLAGARSAEEIAESVRIALEGRPDGATGPHPVVAALVVATGDGAEERAQRELTNWRQDGERGGAVGGDARQIADAVRRFGDAGVTSIMVQATADEPDIAGLIRVLGEVRTLL